MNNVVNQNQKRSIIVGNQSSLLGPDPDALNNLGAGIRASFPILSIDGKAWTAKYEGKEQILSDQRGNPIPEIEVVILEAPAHQSKVFYDKDRPYVPKSGTPPTCSSVNGIIPDKSIMHPVSPTCGACPNNVLGSRIYNGKRLKACADTKRLVVVPAADILNEVWGGPMLLRVPGGSLKNLKLYSEDLAQSKLYFYGCTTIMRFTPGISHQKLMFEYGRPLSDDEVRNVLTLRSSNAVKRILTEEPALDPDAGGGIDDDEGNGQGTVIQSEFVQPSPMQPTVAPQRGFQPPPPPSPHAPQKPATLAPQGIPPQPVRGTAIPPQTAVQPPSTPRQPAARAAGFAPPPVAQATAVISASQTTSKPVGSFRNTTTSSTSTSGASSNTSKESEIGEAVKHPSEAPPSVRQVVAPALPNDEAALEAENTNEETGVALPEEIQNIFGNLMNRK